MSDGVLKPTILDNSAPNVVANNTTTSKSVTEMVRIRSNSKNAGGSSLTTANRSPRPGSLLASSSIKTSMASGNQDSSQQMQNVNIKPLKGPKGKIKNRILMPVNEPEPIIVTSSALAFLNRMLLSAKANSNAAGGTSGGADGVVPGQESSSSSGSPASGGPLQNGTSSTLLPGGDDEENRNTNSTKLPLVKAGADGDKNPDMGGPLGAAPAKARGLSSGEDKFLSTPPGGRSDLQYKDAALLHPEGSAALAPGAAAVAVDSTIGNAGRAGLKVVEPPAGGPTTSNNTVAEMKALKSKRSRSASSLPASGAAAATNDDNTGGSKNRTPSGTTASSSDHRRATSSNRADSSQLRNSSSSIVAGGSSSSAATRNPSSKKSSRSVSPDQDGNILTAAPVATTSPPVSGGTSSKKSAKIVVENRAADPNNTTKSLAGGATAAKVKKSKATSSSSSKQGQLVYNEGEHKAQMVSPAGDEDPSAFRSSSTSPATASRTNKKQLLQLPPAKGNAAALAVAPPAFPTAERAPPVASTGAQTTAGAAAPQTKGVPQLQQLLSPRMGPGGGLIAAPGDRSTTSPRTTGTTSVSQAAGLPPPPPGGADPVPDEKLYYPDSDWLEYPELVLRLMVIRENVILVQPKIVLQLVTRSGLMYELQAQILSNSTSLSSSGSTSSSTKPTNSGGEQVLDTTGANKPSNTEIDQLLQDHPVQYQLLPMLTVHSPNGGILTIKHIINEASPLHEKNLGLRELFLINCSVLAIMHCKYVWVWKDPNLSCCLWTVKNLRTTFIGSCAATYNIEFK